MKSKWAAKQTGFTIVELLIVIVVIAILAAISIVAYNGIQARASDAKIVAGVNQFEKALRIWASDHPIATARGGSSSSTVAANGECSNGANGFLSSGVYVCTLDDALVSAGVLPSGFLSGFPKNTYYPTVTGSNGRYSTMFYACGTGRYALYWTLQNPTTADTSSLNSTISTCVHAGNNLDTTYGMRAARILEF